VYDSKESCFCQHRSLKLSFHNMTQLGIKRLQLCENMCKNFSVELCI